MLDLLGDQMHAVVVIIDESSGNGKYPCFRRQPHPAAVGVASCAHGIDGRGIDVAERVAESGHVLAADGPQDGPAVSTSSRFNNSLATIVKAASWGAASFDWLSTRPR